MKKIIFLLLLMPGTLFASRSGDQTVIINDVTEVTQVEQTVITSGVSDQELAEGLAATMAAGGHQFDFSTYDYQGSIVGSWESGEDENAVSFGLGKRFEKLDALIHTSYTQSDGDHYVTFGGTFRF